MVKIFTQEQDAAIKAAIATAEQRTAAKIGVVVLPSSDHYQDFVLLYGLIAGSTIGLALWAGGLTFYPWLLAAQLGVITLIGFVPWPRNLCIWLIPKRLRRHRAAEMAYREYHILHAALSKNEAFVLLFVSLAECYVHVITNPVVHQKVPENWDGVTNHFTTALRKDGLQAACTQAVDHIVKILESHFPPRAE